MKGIGIETPRSGIAHSMEEALTVQEGLDFHYPPFIYTRWIRRRVAYNIQEFKEICEKGLDLSPTTELLIDESLLDGRNMS